MASNDYKKAEWGYIYCLSNQSLPGMVKIGMTTSSPHQRAKQLSNTSVPTPFKVEFAKYVHFPFEKEQTLHCILQTMNKRIHKNREHFRLTVQETLPYFELIDGSWDPAPAPALHTIPTVSTVSTVSQSRDRIITIYEEYKPPQPPPHKINEPKISNQTRICQVILIILLVMIVILIALLFIH